MSNVVQRILSNAVLFALLMGVSLTLHANATEANLDHVTTSNHFIACDVPDQVNLDLDADSFVNVTSFKAPQPLPKDTHSFYESSILDRPFSTAYQRGPPSYSI
ncbi:MULTISPECIES: hypothetical protein [Pseudoalteromonas]|jgi:hypothetical protein|uniref:Uncharacterized protein n=2 Tax=Pseudoalteromonas aliena TaxID=247523 RepID=A0A1Q2GWT1_9GAMM|nr:MULTISPECIES: hypothetical protein [Pseudoalteromonas]AQP99591.1 hypothetical protein B0W48_07125 [Pseudoalteromonas aliena]MBB1385206.1 hypothetical protein [Pseudoalteromonas sp. SG45-5]MBB1393170.1 hypothetical protein [Pseudoalteromonas sp. SG44-4]MBB1445580.1 hypothetical protein [Pseudoalteromonas sp. SG41-6]MBE0361027.1 hypothetical protein [Pseudoalteromonas aliena SW19]